MYEVRVGPAFATAITDRFGPERSSTGRPSEYDFWSGPLAAALVACRDFESLRYEIVPQIRTLQLVDPVFGPVAFVGVLVDDRTVELAGFDTDPDYWRVVTEDPPG